jgi:hypothetical protein
MYTTKLVKRLMILSIYFMKMLGRLMAPTWPFGPRGVSFVAFASNNVSVAGIAFNRTGCGKKCIEDHHSGQAQDTSTASGFIERLLTPEAQREVEEAVRHNFRCCCTSWPWSSSASTGAMAYDEALSQDMSTLLRYKVGCASRQENIFLFRFNFGATDTQRPHGLHSRLQIHRDHTACTLEA